MKLKQIILYVLVAFLFSCNSLNKKFFDYDELVHYNIEIDESILIENESKKNISADEQLLIDLIIMDEPNSITDTMFVERLEKIGFKKNKVGKTKFDKINEVFKEKFVFESIAYSCIAVYRDILIFKRKNRIVGISKVCFSCNQNRIYGTTANTENFGQNGDYEKLNKILNSKK